MITNLTREQVQQNIILDTLDYMNNTIYWDFLFLYRKHITQMNTNDIVFSNTLKSILIEEFN